MADGRPGAPAPAASNQRYYGDEVSLRELYLTFRSGLPLIVVVALLCAVAAFVVMSLRLDNYTATATVNVIPPLVGTDSLSGLELSVTAGMDPQSYEAIAYGRELLDEVGEQVGLDGAEVHSLVSLAVRQAPSQARGHLVVDHRAVVGGEEGASVADDLADAWARATVAAVAGALSSHLEGAVETVSEEIRDRRDAFQAASDAWAEFLANDVRASLARELTTLEIASGGSEGRAAEVRARLGELEATAATLERELSTASLVYYRVAPTGPALELQRDLVAGSVFVAIPASSPVIAAAASRTAITLAAAAIGALAATVLVFLRAAVRER